MDTIEIGDVCMINSGGTAMTVTGIETTNGRQFFRMYWHDRDCKPHAAALTREAFVLVQKREPAQASVRESAQRVLRAE